MISIRNKTWFVSCQDGWKLGYRQHLNDWGGHVWLWNGSQWGDGGLGVCLSLLSCQIYRDCPHSSYHGHHRLGQGVPCIPWWQVDNMVRWAMHEILNLLSVGLTLCFQACLWGWWTFQLPTKCCGIPNLWLLGNLCNAPIKHLNRNVHHEYTGPNKTKISYTWNAAWWLGFKLDPG